MPRVTWKWIETSLFPVFVADARSAGIDTTGWALDARSGPGRMLARLSVDGRRAVEDVYRNFTSPRDAELVMQGMRYAWALAALEQTGGHHKSEPCDECGEPIPTTAASLVNSAHSRSCSLYAAAVV